MKTRYKILLICIVIITSIFILDQAIRYDNWQKILEENRIPFNPSDEKKEWEDTWEEQWQEKWEDELYNNKCDKSILEHIAKYTNLFDEDFDGNYIFEDLGLEDGGSQEKFEKCFDFILEKRLQELEPIKISVCRGGISPEEWDDCVENTARKNLMELENEN